MSSILQRNQKVAPKKKTHQEHVEDALYREVWEDVNNEKTLKFIKKYYKHILGVAIAILLVAAGFQIIARHNRAVKIQIAETYETALQTMNPQQLADAAQNTSGATSDLALFQAYLLDKDVNKLETLVKDGNTRDFRDLAKLHIVGVRGDDMSADEVKKYLSDMDSKNSPFYYNATLTVAQKYLAEGNRDIANKYLDKIVNDKDAPASILGIATPLR